MAGQNIEIGNFEADLTYS